MGGGGAAAGAHAGALELLVVLDGHADGVKLGQALLRQWQT